jgi:hypothetical protein
MMMMLMECDYVCGLQPTTDLLFILQVIYERGVPWWSDIDRVKLLILAPELSGIPTSSHIVAKKEDLAKEILNLAFEVSLFILRRVL